MWISQAGVLIHHIVRVFSDIIVRVMLKPDIILDNINKSAIVGYKLDIIFPDWEVLLGGICACEGFECVWVKIALRNLVPNRCIVFNHHVVSLEGIVLLSHCSIRCEWDDVSAVLERHYIARKPFGTTITRIMDTYQLLSGIILITISFIIISSSIAVVRQMPCSSDS